MNEPLFSVIIPLYNKAAYIAPAVQSVLNQSLPDFELLIIDDASTDGGPEKLARFSDSRLRLISRDKPGAGGYAARNCGIAAARGTWIAFLDADDTWEYDHLQQVQAAAAAIPNAYIIGCGWRIVHGQKSELNPFYRRFRNSRHLRIPLSAYLKYAIRECRPIHTSIACVRRDSPLCPHLFPAKRSARRGGDVHAWLRLMAHHGQMAWSGHIGAVYNSSVEQQVIKSAASSADLMRKSLYRELVADLPLNERRLVACYMNYRLITGWLGNEKRGKLNFSLVPRLYWVAEPVYCLMAAVITLLPRRLTRHKRRYIKVLSAMKNGGLL